MMEIPITNKLRLEENDLSTNSTPIATTPTTINFQLDAEADAELYGQDPEDATRKPTMRSPSPALPDKVYNSSEAHSSPEGGIPGLFLITDPAQTGTDIDNMALDNEPSVPVNIHPPERKQTRTPPPLENTTLTREDFKFALEPEFSQASGTIITNSGKKFKEEPKDDPIIKREDENSTEQENSHIGKPVNSGADVDMTVPDATQLNKEEILGSVTEHEQFKSPVDPGFLAAGETNKDSQDAEWQLDSSNEESSDEDSDDSDSSSEAVSDDDYPMMGREELAKLLMEEGGDDEDGDRKEGFQGPLKTKNEIPEEALKIERPNIVVTDDMKIEVLGAVESIVGTMVLIKASVSGNHRVLNEGSLLVFEDRSILGSVADTFGRVEEPLYTVRFNSPKEIEETGVKLGQHIYYVPDHSEYVFTQALKAIKGSDASNIFDEEVGDAEREFSDDEAEAEAKRTRKRQATAGNRARNERRNPIQKPTIRETDEPYVPLPRPTNLQELLSQPPPPMNSGAGRSDRGHHRGGRGRGKGGQRGNARGVRGNHGGGDSRRQDGGDHVRNSRDGDEGAAGYQQRSQGYCQLQDNRPSYTPQQQYNSYQQTQYQQQQNYQTQSYQQQQPQSLPQYPQYPQFPGYLPQTQPPYQYPPQQQNLFPGTLPQGSHVNPAFFRNQQQQSMPSSPVKNDFIWTPPVQQQVPYAGSPNMQQQTSPANNEAALKALQNLLSLSKAAQGQK